MQTHNLKRKTANKKSRQVGRGGTRGKTSGRGTKGQLARAGHKARPEIRDIIKRLPKLRGYSFKSIAWKAEIVDLTKLEAAFSAGDVVSPTSLLAKGLVRQVGGLPPVVKILSDGEVTKKLVVEDCLISANAKAKIEKAGGTVKITDTAVKAAASAKEGVENRAKVDAARKTAQANQANQKPEPKKPAAPKGDKKPKSAQVAPKAGKPAPKK